MILLFELAQQANQKHFVKPGFGVSLLPISAGVGCNVATTTKVSNEIFMRENLC